MQPYSVHIHTHPQPSAPSTIFSTSPGDDRRTPVSDLEAAGREREREAAEAEAAPSLCVFPLQSRTAQHLTHSLWDPLDNSPSGKCGWIPNENRSSLCFINCCYYRHFQIPHIPLTNRQPCRYVGAGKRRKMLVCHCSSVAVHFLCNWCEAADMHVEAFGLCVFVADRKFTWVYFYCTTHLFLSFFFYCCRGELYLKYTRHLWI